MTKTQIVEQHIIDGMGTNVPDSYELLARLINSDWEFETPELAAYAAKMRGGEYSDEEALWAWAESLCQPSK